MEYHAMKYHEDNFFEIVVWIIIFLYALRAVLIYCQIKKNIYIYSRSFTLPAYETETPVKNMQVNEVFDVI